jgi:glutamate N-acetyltransferase/amino-acid N-acetyltransferase
MSITRPLGFRAASVTAGLKPSGKSDLALIVCDDRYDAPVVRGKGHPIHSRRASAACFTQNVVLGAPVILGKRWREAAARGAKPLRALLINAGAANAATGEAGIEDALACTGAVASALGLERDEVLASSTGVVGRRIPVDKITAAVPALVAQLGRGEAADAAAARAIMTTDLVPKRAHREVELAGHTVHLGAIAKGSGMIAPNMDAGAGGGVGGNGSAAPAGWPAHATMLAFVTTDAAIDPRALQQVLDAAVAESFNRISVDAHPSCSDTMVALASGAAPVDVIHAGSPEFHAFKAALTSLCQDLATQVVRDGEGATRIFRVEVRGAQSEGAAVRLARAVVDSPLVKCAVHGRDPNWGRIVTAAGNAGVPFDTGVTSLSIGPVEVYAKGVPTGVSKTDPALAEAMNRDTVHMRLTVGDGPGSAWMVGCDLSADYVKINADYTT